MCVFVFPMLLQKKKRRHGRQRDRGLLQAFPEARRHRHHSDQPELRRADPSRDRCAHGAAAGGAGDSVQGPSVRCQQGFDSASCQGECERGWQNAHTTFWIGSNNLLAVFLNKTTGHVQSGGFGQQPRLSVPSTSDIPRNLCSNHVFHYSRHHFPQTTQAKQYVNVRLRYSTINTLWCVQTFAVNWNRNVFTER